MAARSISSMYEGRALLALRADPTFRGDAQVADHVDGEAALAVEHFIDAIGLADRGHQILPGQAALFHAETNRSDGVGRLDREMPGLVGFHQRVTDLQPRASHAPP